MGCGGKGGEGWADPERMPRCSYRELAAPARTWLCFGSFPCWASRCPLGRGESPTGLAAGVGSDWKAEGRSPGKVLLGWGWTAWAQICLCAAPADAWASPPGSCLLPDSALWQRWGPGRARRPLGAHLSAGGEWGNLDSGLALRAWTCRPNTTLGKQKDGEEISGKTGSRN